MVYELLHFRFINRIISGEYFRKQSFSTFNTEKLFCIQIKKISTTSIKIQKDNSYSICNVVCIKNGLVVTL